MAQLLTPQAPRPAEPDPGSQAAPIVVCPLDSSREGRHAVAVAASLSRRLGGQLALVHGGSTPLDPAQFAAVAVQEHATLIVISAAPGKAHALVVLAECAVVVVPPGAPASGPLDEGPIVCVVDRGQDAGRVASQATRFALQIGTTLRLVQIDADTPAEHVSATAKATGATLLIVGADDHGAVAELVLEAADVPVMLIPVGLRLSAPDRGQERR